MTRVFLTLVLFSAVALGQTRPEEEWGDYPAGTPPPAEAPATNDAPPPPPPPLPAPAPLEPSAAPSASRVSRRPRPPQQPNTVSMFGAATLGQWVRGQSAAIGFPLISLRFLLGLADRFDLGVGFDTYYLMMNEPLLTARLLLTGSKSFNLSLVLDAGYAFFNVRASRETRGPRWLTGRRNINVSPGLVGSFQGSHPRAARLFFEARYLLALDTEPYTTDPLAGVPPPLLVGHNFSLRGGAELPLSATTAFVFWLGFDAHARPIDVPLMPQIAVGIATSL